jgi:hypothetical protein
MLASSGRVLREPRDSSSRRRSPASSRSIVFGEMR